MRREFQILRPDGSIVDETGSLPMAECCSFQPEVSLDGRFVAWVAKGDLTSSTGLQSICTRGEDIGLRRYGLRGTTIELFAVSGMGMLVILGTVLETGKKRLFRLPSPHVQEEVGYAEDLNSVQRLQVSTDGSYLLVRTRTDYKLIHLQSGNVLRRGEASGASLHPDGNRIAFISKDHQLVMGSREGKAWTSAGITAYFEGIGGFRPDGRVLFAGVRSLDRLGSDLVLLDLLDNCTIKYKTLGMSNSGFMYRWIRKDMVTRLSQDDLK